MDWYKVQPVIEEPKKEEMKEEKENKKEEKEAKKEKK